MAYKTYIVGGLCILGAIGAYAAGNNDMAIQLFLMGAGFLGLRHAISNLE